ncbi:MAG: GDP-mannose 4,6-dehydratase [Bacteroidales bacterium]|nr:GDP-mannose 4,6-dehydratase [Bacteroidales bacterium]
MKILVTGGLGFIGYHLTELLIKEGFEIIGLDNINDYYARSLKTKKLPILGIDTLEPEDHTLYPSRLHPSYSFVKMDITNRQAVEALFHQEKFDIIINLAAQAGVQYSLQNPHTYVDTNVVGFINLLDASRHAGVKHFIYASSSSVYGNREDVPFREEDRVDNPISMYAATKKANELMAYSYSHLYQLKTTGLRFFTVYGPWGRPDMAPYIFMKKILAGDSIDVFNNGNLERDFTYVDDIVQGIRLTMNQQSVYEVYNIGNSNPVNLNDFIATLEDVLQISAKIIYRPMRIGDVYRTYSDVTRLQQDYGYQPTTDVKEGLTRMAEWFKVFGE